MQSSKKTEFLRNGKNVLMETLTKASEDPVFNLPIGKKESPGTKAASLAKELVKWIWKTDIKAYLKYLEGT